MCSKALVALLSLACLLPTSKAADSGLAESDLAVSDARRSLLANPNNPTFQTCPASPCTCYGDTWSCIVGGAVSFVIDKNTPANQHCTNGHFERNLVGEDCRCVSTTLECVRTPEDHQLPGNDPIITGFDERKFHFNDVGNFTLLSDAEGYLLEATFVGVGPIISVPKETSWTSQVRIYNPKVSAQAAGSSKGTLMTPFHRTSVQFEDMSATAVLSEGPNPVVIGCHVALPKLEVTVYQVSGWEQASQFESEKWAAPYTWLNFDVKLLKPLSLPVMGILGATYPATAQDQAALDANSETAKVIKAHVATDPVAMRELEETAPASGKARRLASADVFPLAATFKGVQLP
ncbi:hypothetical protein N2152v2_011077 [Parachlorella kessleri]